MKTVQVFFDVIRNRIRLEGLRSVRIRVRISNIRYRIRIRILKSHIYNVDIQSYSIRHDWHYPHSNSNPIRNMKTNVILVISVRIWSVFIPSAMVWGYGLWAVASLGCLDRNNSRRKEAIEFIQQKAASMIKSFTALPHLPLILSLSSAYSILNYNRFIAGIFYDS